MKTALAGRGFTLVEALVAMALGALLCTLAYPAYTAQVGKARRAECRGALLQSLQQQERYYTQNGVYAVFGAGATEAPVLSHSGESPERAACLVEAAPCEAGEAAEAPTLAQCVEMRGAFRADAGMPTLFITTSNVRGCVRPGGERSTDADCWH